MQVASAEIALKSESVLHASRNAEEATLEAETTESVAAMSKPVRVDDNAAQATIQLRQQAIERGKRIFAKRRQRKSVSPRAQSFSTRASNSSKMQVMLQKVLDSQATQAEVAGQCQAQMKAQMDKAETDRKAELLQLRTLIEQQGARLIDSKAQADKAETDRKAEMKVQAGEAETDRKVQMLQLETLIEQQLQQGTRLSAIE